MEVNWIKFNLAVTCDAMQYPMVSCCNLRMFGNSWYLLWYPGVFCSILRQLAVSKKTPRFPFYALTGSSRPHESAVNSSEFVASAQIKGTPCQDSKMEPKWSYNEGKMEPFAGPWTSLGRPLGVLGWPLASFESPLGLLRVAGRSLEDRLVVV